jgi:glycosyltransferase involved in cell wall biosynthesis
MHAKPLRALHVVEATTAGVRRYVTSLVVGLRARGMEIAIAAPWRRSQHYGDTTFVENLRQEGVPFYPVPMQRRIGVRDGVALAALWRLLRTEHFALVHTHSSKGGFLGRVAAGACNLPVIHTPNGLYFLEKTGASRQFYLKLERLAGHLTTTLIAVSEDERAVLVQNNVVEAERIRVIHNGVDVACIDGEARLTKMEAKSRLGIRPDRRVVGVVGRLVPQKDPLAFVEAAAQVADQAPGTLCVWVGSGPLRADVESQAKTKDIPVRILGHREDVWKVMRAFDVFVLPSRYEGLPFALLEAMALSLPVVATNIVGVRDVIEHQATGLIVPAKAPAAIADAVLSLFRDPEWADRLAVAARQKVVTEFALEQMLDRHQMLYEELSARHAQSRAAGE